MLHNYNSFILILESNARNNKINKVKEKIKKFANFPDIYDWVIDKCITDKSTEGLQYAVWIANELKQSIVSGIIDVSDNKFTEDRINKFFNGDNDIELENEIIEKWHSISSLIKSFQESINEELNYILDWLKNPLRDEKVNLANLSFNEAWEKSDEWHKSLKATGKIIDETGKVIIEFEDGSYWIDLQTTFSKEESNAMGHCGNTNDGDTLLSYRDKNKSPHITVAFDSKDGVIYQMKGRQNKKPVEKYFPYIYRLLIDPNIKPKYFGYEYLKETDFNLSDFDKETFQKVYNYNPDLIYKSIEHDSKMFKNLIEKNYIEKEKIIKVLENINDLKFYMEILDNDIFTIDELKILYENLNVNLIHYGELPKIILYKKSIIDVEEFASYFEELSIRIYNGKKIIEITGDKDDLEYFMSDNVSNILFNENPFFDWDFPYTEMVSASDIWYKLKKEVKEKVIEYIIGVNITIDDQDIEITNDKIQWINNDYYLVYNEKKYKLDDILDENKYDSLTNLYQTLSISLNAAQTRADENEYFKQSEKSLVKVLGHYEIKEIVKMKNDKKFYSDVFRFNFDIVNLDIIEDILTDEYKRYNDNEINYEHEYYGSIWQLMRLYIEDTADINDDYYYYGDINIEDLNDSVLNNLDDL